MGVWKFGTQLLENFELGINYNLHVLSIWQGILWRKKSYVKGWLLSTYYTLNLMLVIVIGWDVVIGCWNLVWNGRPKSSPINYLSYKIIKIKFHNEDIKLSYLILGQRLMRSL